MGYWLGLWLIAAGLTALPASANAAKTKARLVLAAESARPGQTVVAGIQLSMPNGWHTYWRNPGDSGAPTTIEWDLPEGVSAGQTQWPIPEKFDEAGLTTYVYHDEVVLLVPLSLDANLAQGQLELQAKVSWLECEKQCVPGEADVKARLTIADKTEPSPESELIGLWEKQLPKTAPAPEARAWWDDTANAEPRALIIEWASSEEPDRMDFFPYSSDAVEVLPQTERLQIQSGKIWLRKKARKFQGNWPEKLAGLLVIQAGMEHPPTGFEVALKLTFQEASLPAKPEAGYKPQRSLVLMLAYAFIGGLILNIMPCVLPVIALKVLGFVNQDRLRHREGRRLGLVYAAGVLVSFLVLAAIVIGVKLAGHKAGWGMQFGNPQFLVVLTVLITLVALNLFGLFEVTLGGNVLGAAGTLAAKEGVAGAFFNGVLATTLATPCTAPFLGAALGFAFLQPPAVVVLIFLTVGAGLAIPYVVLSWNPALLQFLPKPGQWMERFKVAMGFPMLATAVWLFSLTETHYGRRVLWLGLFLVGLALAAWMYGEFVQRGRKGKTLALSMTLLVLAGSYVYALERQLQWRSPVTDSDNPSALKNSPDGIDWRRWSSQAVAEAQAEGRPVLVDFTADWCLICQVNKKISIETPSVQEKLKQINAVALLADYTKLPDNITAELNRFGRAGVPLVLVYPRKPGQPPIILPEVLTPQTVLDALDKAAL